MPAGTRDACGVKRNPISWPSTVGGEQVLAREVTRAVLAVALAAAHTVTTDPHGHAFVAYVATDSAGHAPYWGKGGSRNGVFARRSLDGGRTWEKSHAPVIEYPAIQDPPFQDKPYLVSDNNG